MQTKTLLDQYADAIRIMDLDAVEKNRALPPSLLLSQEGGLQSYYAPFDWTNHDARLVLVGVTPGLSQSIVALRKAQALLKSGMPADHVVREAKRAAGFAGKLRPNLVALLDHFGLQRWIGVTSCSELFEYRSNLMHTTSVLRFPTFVGGKNYNGTPSVFRSPTLRQMMLDHFGSEVGSLRNAVFVPLGSKVSEVMAWLCEEGIVDRERVLSGLPHPSGENGERVKYVLGLKARATLSAKTDAKKLDAASAQLHARIAAL